MDNAVEPNSESTSRQSEADDGVDSSKKCEIGSETKVKVRMTPQHRLEHSDGRL